MRAKAVDGNTARLVAGFCWPWSDPKSDGTLVEDVVVGDWQMPWNAKPTSGGWRAESPSPTSGRTDLGGLEQVGCVYTAQGFEFDYVGVIFGTDLRFDADADDWVGTSASSFDSVVKRSGDKFTDW